MNPNLNALRIALLQCLSSPDVTADEVTEVVRETVRSKMDESQETVKKSRTVLEKLRIPYHYTTCPDYLSNPVGTGWSESDYISFSSDTVAAQPVTMGYDGIVGAYGEDSIILG